MKRVIISAIMIVTSVLIASGQQQYQNVDTSRLWGLHDCMRFAIDNSPSVVRQQLANANTKTSYTQAILSHLPSLNAGVSGSFGFGRGIDPVDNSYTTVSNFNSGINAGTGISIFNGLSMLNRTRISKIQTLRGDERFKQIEDDISLLVLQAYYDFIYKLGTMKLALEQVDAASENLLQGQRMMELGLKGLADVAQLEATLAANEDNLVSIENNMRISELNLKKQMNYPPSELLKIDTAHRYAVPAPETTELSKIVDYAVTTQSEILLSEMDVRISELDLVTAKASLYPSLNASGGVSSGYSTAMGEFYGNSDPFKDQLKNRLGYSAGMSMSIPIFGAWSRQFNITRQRNNVRAQEQTHIETQRAIVIEVEQAVLDLNGAFSSLESAKKRLASQLLSHRVAQRKFREGLFSPLDLQTIANDLLSARASLLNAEVRWQAARKVVDYYKGIPLLSE